MAKWTGLTTGGHSDIAKVALHTVYFHSVALMCVLNVTVGH